MKRIIFEIEAEAETAKVILNYLWQAFERLDLHEELNGQSIYREP